MTPLAQADDLVRSFDWHSAPPGWLFVLFILPAVLAYASYVYAREGGNVSGGARVLLGFLRILVLLALLGVLFDPFFERTSFRVLSSQVLILHDDSQSMRDVRDGYETEEALRMAKALGLIEEELPRNLDRGDVQRAFVEELERRHPGFDLDRDLSERFPSRISVVNHLLGEGDRAGLRRRLSERHEVVEYAFSGATRAEVEGPDGAPAVLVPRLLSRDPAPGKLEGAGPETALRDAIQAAVAEMGEKPLAAVIVVTDGASNSDRETSIDPEELWARRLGVPVYAVGIGNPNPPKDLDLAQIEAEKFVFKDNKTAIVAHIEATGYEGEEVRVELELPPDEVRDKADGEPMIQRIVLGPDGTRDVVTFNHTFKHKGTHIVRIHVERLPKERTYENNVRQVEIEVIDQQIRVLIVEGQPRWEFRYLRNAAIRDEKLKTNTILLDADPTFPQDRSPDAPDMNRFPSTPEGLQELKREFHVILFGDFAPTMLGEGWERILKEIKNWVESEYFGGGFILMAGQQYTPEAWVGTEIEKILPVEIEDNPPPAPAWYKDVFYPRVTALGWNHPVTRLVPEDEANRRLWTDHDYGLPGVFWYKKVRRTRPGAMVLLDHPADVFETERGTEPQPIVTVGRYGHGQTMFVSTDEFWRWRFLTGDKYCWQFWKQAIFFMAKRRLLHGDSRWRIWTDKTEYPVGERIVVHAEVRDEASEPAKEKEQAIYYQVRWGGGEGEEVLSTEARTLKLAQVPDQPGKYQGTLNLFRPGEYVFWFWARGEKDVAPTEKGRHSIRVLDSTLETRKPSQDRKTLQKIAAASGGRYLPIWELAALPAPEPKTQREPAEKSEESAWHNGLVYWVLVAVLVLEWILRKIHRML
ncbi:MAG: VWA domain-containing protein [Planctomycetes bacterium]|nr:VWA domain-containing protein [Planctomycetota bacterium]